MGSNITIAAPLPAESDAESVADDRSIPKPTSPSGQAKEELKDAVMGDAKANDEAVDAADADEEDSDDDNEEFVPVRHRAEDKLNYELGSTSWRRSSIIARTSKTYVTLCWIP